PAQRPLPRAPALSGLGRNRPAGLVGRDRQRGRPSQHHSRPDRRDRIVRADARRRALHRQHHARASRRPVVRHPLRSRARPLPAPPDACAGPPRPPHHRPHGPTPPRPEAGPAPCGRPPMPVQARLGNPITAGMAGPHLAWLRRNEPDVLDRARWALHPKAWVRARLTGQGAAEPSDASGTLLYDVSTQDWDATVIEALEISRSLLAPILLHSGVAAGTLTPTVAADLGLPAGLPVAAGAADTAAAALGTGLLVPGRTQLTIGTGVQIVSIVTGPGPHDAASLPTAPSPSASSYAPTEAEAPVTHLCRDSTPHGWYAMA